ncbi:MAG TPA: lysophospholipid acyltransferase family protein [Verrucomicrobiae bacterium]|nr:lysophospholipid acyltransferase family protein [Verrucomicrobiae bacterium]
MTPPQQPQRIPPQPTGGSPGAFGASGAGDSNNDNASAPRQGGAGGIVVPHRPRWYQRGAAWLIYALIRVVAATLRVRWHDQADPRDRQRPGPRIYCSWHNRLVLSATAYADYVQRRNPTAGLAAMVSASKDGAFLAAILQCFGIHPVRGSSSRRGPQALLELTTWAERGYDLAITPDGPRGPCCVVQEGVMSLAQVTGLPIVPFSYHLNWKIRVRSWDRFQIPLPFARCEMRLGAPIHVARETSDDQRELLRQKLEQTLRELSSE